MKKIILQLFTTVLVVNSFCQTETFDIAKFIPPVGWQRIDSNGVVAFLDSKTNNGLTSFCQIFLYPSRSSKDAPLKNFQTEWNNRVVKSTGTKEKPTTATEKNPDGWTSVTGYSNITNQGVTYTCMLVTASGFGKAMSVMVNVAGQEYMKDVEAFFAKMDLDPNAVVSNTNNQPIQTNNQSKHSFHLIQYTPPANWAPIQNEGSRQYMISDSVNNTYCIITVYAAFNSTGTQESDFSEEWKLRVTPIATSAEKPKTQKSNIGIEPNFIQGSKQVSLKNSGESFFVRLIVLRMINQRQSISIMSGSEQMLNGYSNTISSFISSIEKNTMMDNNNNATTVTSSENYMNNNPINQNLGSNNGTLYVGMQGGTGGYDYGNSKRYLYLSPDNSFRYGYSKDGYYKYNTQIDRSRTPDYAGTYTKSGNNISLNFYSGRKMQFTVNNNKDLDGDMYRLTCFPSLNGHTIEGFYTQPNQRADANGRVRRAALHKNGRFEDDGLLLIGNQIDQSLPYPVWLQKTTENATPGNGSYVIVDNSILLSYDDGRRIQLMIYISLEDINKTSPNLIVIAGESLILAK